MKQYKFVINGNQYEVEIKDYSNDVAELEVNGTPFRVEVEHTMTLTKTPKISRPVARTPVAAAPVAVSGGATPVLSPLPGTIMQVVVKPGDKVQKGDKLLIMEAMKMENNIQSDLDGVVSSVKVAAGDNVLQGAVLLEIE